MKRYPMIEFTVRHGRKAAPAVASVLLLVGVYVWLATGRIDGLFGGLLLAVAGYFLFRLFVEILDVISETLLPR